MKKIIFMLTALTVLGTTGTIKADEVISNMTSDVFLENRLEKLEEALEDGIITSSEYETIYNHFLDVAATGSFGEGRDGDCLLGEEGYLFRNENSGYQNGYGMHLSDGFGNGQKNRRNGRNN